MRSAGGARAAIGIRPWDVASNHLTVSLRRVSPTAIGRTPPSFFFSGMRRAAHRNGAARGWRRPALIVVTRVSRASSRPALAALSAEFRQSSRCWGRSPEGPAALPRGNEPTRASIARRWSVAHEGVTSGRSSGSGAASPDPAAWGCSSLRRASTAGSAESQTPSEVSSWRALPGAPSARRARTAAAVRSEAGTRRPEPRLPPPGSWPTCEGHLPVRPV